ncbi:protein N-terminal glutamine amidohydrolase [Gymnopus androsaceus JB14]|uniref:Protein N-terminal glutamine amidohydrolase n=1 Tax=Gymnopus androsaceus JB14 TaxID=1447944 RepID=A0A6A4HUZ4_9AGAR|nr:protein N-terminal glutamine amidohydrolase [Gymnopus androsaceus JB14]
MPPALPLDAVYTSHWCEENVYLLVQSFQHPSISELWDVFAVFISNHAKMVALWNQKLSKEPGLPVVWDYHVITVLRSRQDSLRTESWVYDFDTTLGMPVTWDTYFAQTFSTNVPEAFQSAVFSEWIPANIYLDRFASDRSHMLDKAVSDLKYLQPPPLYPAIRGKLCKSAIIHNLMDFVSMLPTDGYGDVKDMQAISEFLGQPEDPEEGS